MRMSWRCKCDYEFGRHAKSAATPELLDVAVGPVDAPGLSDSDRLLLKLVDELYEQHDLTDQTFEALSREWTPGEMIELVTVAGGYWQAAAVANVARVKDTAHAGA
jgi:alkylhydroperoxidase family enzyme